MFKEGIKLFSLLLLPHKFSVTNSVDMSKIDVFIGGTALIWLESGINAIMNGLYYFGMDFIISP